MRQTFFPSVAQSHRHFEGDKSGPNLSPAISVFITPLDVWLTPENKKEIILTQTPFSLNGRKSVVFKFIQKIAELFKDNGGLQTVVICNSHQTTLTSACNTVAPPNDCKIGRLFPFVALLYLKYNINKVIVKAIIFY